MRLHMLVIAATLLLALSTGCSTTRQQTAEVDEVYTAPMSVYSVMDSTALIYSDASAAAPVSDNPWRWAGFILHPVGNVLDYAINRPLYKLVSLAPYVFGYTAEDSMLDSQRR